MLFYKISPTVKLALLELLRFALTGQYSPAEVSKLCSISFALFDSIINQMEVRFDDFHQMEFSSLLDSTKF